MIAVEATVRSWSKRATGEVSIGIIVHRDDVSKVDWIAPGMRAAVAFAEIKDDETLAQSTQEGKAQRDPTPHENALDKPQREEPARSHNPYSRRAGILANNTAFQRFCDVTGVPDPAAYAASYIRLICGVKSRKDILPGTDAAEKFEKLSTDFAIWHQGPRHGL